MGRSLASRYPSVVSTERVQVPDERSISQHPTPQSATDAELRKNLCKWIVYELDDIGAIATISHLRRE